MRDQLSLTEIDEQIAAKQLEIDALTDARSALLDAINALDGMSNGTPAKRQRKKPNGDGPDLFASQTDDELAADVTNFLDDADKTYTIRSLVKELAAGEYSDASKDRLHTVAKTISTIKIGRGGAIVYTPEQREADPEQPDSGTESATSDTQDALSGEEDI